MNFRWLLVEAIAPIFRLLPPWWRVRVYQRIAGEPFSQGNFNGRMVRRRVAPHSFEMDLRLDDWMERSAAFIGIYYEIEATEVLRQLLRPGDILVDVGANVGFLTLTGVSLVGPSGRVISVEPNAELLERVRACVSHNGISNVELCPFALGETRGVAKLIIESHHGAASLRHRNSLGVDVEVAPGDVVLSGAPQSAWCLIKIDVEGYEQKALKGFESTLARRRTAFLIEITEDWLELVGGSAETLFKTMFEAGYQAFRPIVSRRGFTLLAINGHLRGTKQYDAVFLRAEDRWCDR